MRKSANPKYEKLLLDEIHLIHCQDFKLEHFSSPFHFHDEYELVLIVKGHGKVYVGNTVSNFKDGDLFFFAPGLPHCFINIRDNTKKTGFDESAVVHIKKELFGQDFLDKREASHLKKHLKVSACGIKYVNPSKIWTTRYYQLKQKQNLERVAEIFKILDELSRIKSYELLCAEEIAYKMNSLDSIIINDILQYITENIQEPITLDTAASIANMQKSAFCKYFKRKTQKNFTQVVNEVRIIHAKKLLEETDHDIKHIAYECGYDSASYFYRKFKQHCNTSPTNFRQQLQVRPF